MTIYQLRFRRMCVTSKPLSLFSKKEKALRIVECYVVRWLSKNPDNSISRFRFGKGEMFEFLDPHHADGAIHPKVDHTIEIRPIRVR